MTRGERDEDDEQDWEDDLLFGRTKKRGSTAALLRLMGFARNAAGRCRWASCSRWSCRD